MPAKLRRENVLTVQITLYSYHPRSKNILFWTINSFFVGWKYKKLHRNPFKLGISWVYSIILCIEGLHFINKHRIRPILFEFGVLRIFRLNTHGYFNQRWLLLINFSSRPTESIFRLFTKDVTFSVRLK